MTFRTYSERPLAQHLRDSEGPEAINKLCALIATAIADSAIQVVLHLIPLLGCKRNDFRYAAKWLLVATNVAALL